MNDNVLFFSRCTDANLVEFVSGAIENVIDEEGGLLNVGFSYACVYGVRSAVYYLESEGLEYIPIHYTSTEVSFLAEAFEYLSMEDVSWILQRLLREFPEAFDAEDGLEAVGSRLPGCEELSSHLPVVLANLDSESKIANFIRLCPVPFFDLDLSFVVEHALSNTYAPGNPGFLGTIFRSCQRYAARNSGKLPNFAQLKEGCAGVEDDRVRLLDARDYVFMNSDSELSLGSPPCDYIRYVKAVGGRFYLVQTDGGLISRPAKALEPEES